MLAFYTWNPKARNYGGSTTGLRWLFWLIPALADRPADRPRRSRAEVAKAPWALLALMGSMLTVGYSLRSPWTNPWISDLLEHLGWYTLVR